MTGGAMLLIAVAVLLVIGVVASNLKKKSVPRLRGPGGSGESFAGADRGKTPGRPPEGGRLCRSRNCDPVTEPAAKMG